MLQIFFVFLSIFYLTNKSIFSGSLKEKLFVIDVDYTLINEKKIARLYCKDAAGKTILVIDGKFNPYFYALPSSDAKKLKKRIDELDQKKTNIRILKVEVVEKIRGLDKKEFVKITLDNPRDVPAMRDVIKHWEEVEDTYEYDIPFPKRYIIDKQIEPAGWIEVEGEEIAASGEYQVDKIIDAKSVKAIDSRKQAKLKILAFDIELVEDAGKQKLIMLSVFGNFGLKKVFTLHPPKKKLDYIEVVNDEAEIVKRFVEVVNDADPDFLVGYNSDGFDFPKIKDVASKAKIPLKLSRDGSQILLVRRGRISSAKSRGRVHIDLFNFVGHILSASMKSEILSLDAVAQELLGMGKKELDYRDMKEIWSKKDDIERLAEYCAWDSELTLKLAEHILPQIFALCKLTSQLPFDAARYSYSQLVESFYMKHAFTDNVIIPNRPKTEEIEQRRMQPIYRGAIVFEPKKGIHNNVMVFDFRSLYPTIIVTHNIDPYTFNIKSCKKKISVPESKNYFCYDKKGFIPKHLEYLITMRRKVKEDLTGLTKDSEEWHQLDNMQYALKILANATYGYLAYFGAKWYRLECGSAAASFGRYYITKVVDSAMRGGFDIIYGDTDSLMVRYPKKLSQNELRAIGKKFVNKINKQLPGIIELEFRDLYESGIFVAREKGEDVGAKKRYALIDYHGNLEIRGFETVRRDWCELAKKIQRDVLVKILKDKDPKKAVAAVRKTIEEIKEGRVPLADLTILEQITRPLASYQQKGPHVRAAMRMQDKGKIVGEGSVVAFVIVRGQGSISDRAMPVEDVKPKQYDPDYYINNQVVPASMRVLKALGLTEEEVISGKTQKGLKGFLKK